MSPHCIIEARLRNAAGLKPSQSRFPYNKTKEELATQLDQSNADAFYPENNGKATMIQRIKTYNNFIEGYSLLPNTQFKPIVLCLTTCIASQDTT